MERKFGVSVASLLPRSLGKDGFKRSIEIAIEKAGFNGLQTLPFRRWERFSIDRTMYKDCIISFEDAWNSGSFFGAIKREMYQLVTRKKCAMEYEPRLYDYAIFGSLKKSEKAVQEFIKTFPHAIYVSNGWKDGRNYGAIELCPEMTPEQIQSALNGAIVFDTMHVVRPGRHGEPPIAKCWKWKDLIDLISPERIKLIHVKPDFPAGSELPQMLSALGKKTKNTKCPVILEAKPIFKSQKKTIDWLKKQLAFLRMHFD